MIATFAGSGLSRESLKCHGSADVAITANNPPRSEMLVGFQSVKLSNGHSLLPIGRRGSSECRQVLLWVRVVLGCPICRAAGVEK